MPLELTELLAEPSLRLVPKTTHCHSPQRSISWVSSTELPDPLPFLRGSELVLTTCMYPRSVAEWRQLVQALVALPVAGLCIGTGLINTVVPEELITCAEAEGLAVLESPVQVPFIQISRWVADRLFAEKYENIRELVALQDDLVQRLLAGGSLTSLLSSMHHRLGNLPLRIVQPDGHVLASHPRKYPDDRHDTFAGTRIPIRIGGTPLAYLETPTVSEHRGILSFAASMLGLELARRHALLTGRRELVGQCLEDIVNGTVSEAEAKRKLSQHGLELEHPFQVVLATVDNVKELQKGTWALAHLATQQTEVLVSAIVSNSVVILVPEDADAERVGSELWKNLLGSGTAPHGVGISQSRRLVPGFRPSYFEAKEASHAGSAVQHASPLSLTGLLLGNLDLPLRELSLQVLKPLLDYDRERAGGLLDSLTAFIDNDCSHAATADALGLHRNTLRYRLELVQKVTGRDLNKLDERFELSLALRGLEIGS